MKKLYLFLLIAVLPISAFGQNKFKNGYIITFLHDTVFGKIQEQNSNKTFCKFQNIEGKVVDYQPNDIYAFGYTKGKVYVSKRTETDTFFVEYLIEGSLNLYCLRNGKQNRYFIDNETDSLTEIKLIYEMIEGETGMKLWKLSNQHVELLNKFTEKVPELKRKIRKIDLLEDDILIDIIEKYNKTVCGQKECKNECCKVFKTDIYKFNFELNPVVGFNAFVSRDLTFSVGLLGNFKLPKCGNMLFVKTGFFYSKITNIQAITKQSGFIQIPLQIEVRYPIKYFRPKVAVGLNLTSLKHLKTFYTSMFSVGSDIFLTKKIFFLLNYDLNFEPLFLVIPIRLSYHSLMFGVNIMF